MPTPARGPTQAKAAVDDNMRLHQYLVAPTATLSTATLTIHPALVVAVLVVTTTLTSDTLSAHLALVVLSTIAIVVPSTSSALSISSTDTAPTRSSTPRLGVIRQPSLQRLQREIPTRPGGNGVRRDACHDH